MNMSRTSNRTAKTRGGGVLLTLRLRAPGRSSLPPG